MEANPSKAEETDWHAGRPGWAQAGRVESSNKCTRDFSKGNGKGDWNNIRGRDDEEVDDARIPVEKAMTINDDTPNGRREGGESRNGDRLSFDGMEAIPGMDGASPATTRTMVGEDRRTRQEAEAEAKAQEAEKEDQQRQDKREKRGKSATARDERRRGGKRTEN